MFHPFFLPHHAAPAQSLDTPPARVRVAMQYLALCNQKTGPKLLPGGFQNEGLHEVEGEKLTEHEGVTQRAACTLLEMYFLGRLPPSCWEQAHVAHATEGRVGFHASDDPQPEWSCPVCKNQNSNCLMCWMRRMASGG